MNWKAAVLVSKAAMSGSVRNEGHDGSAECNPARKADALIAQK